MYVAFRTRKDGFALEILEKIRNSEGNWLNLIVMTDDNPDKKNIPDVVKKIANGLVTKAWVCGPSGFNRYYSNLLIEYGVGKDKIIIL